MKERVETITDFFVDYAGKEHYFVVAAISKMLPKIDEGHTVWHEVVKFWSDDDEETINILTKCLCLGISICNPIDQFDEKVGVAKAISRARNSDPVMFVSNPGLINTKMVKALLEQEAEYLKNNPEVFIKGYEEGKNKYLARKEKETMKENFTDIEKQIVEHTQNNPNFLDNILKYFGWKK